MHDRSLGNPFTGSHARQGFAREATKPPEARELPVISPLRPRRFGALGVAMHSKALLYAGYGFLGGCGVGVAYTPPLQALMQWFPGT